MELKEFLQSEIGQYVTSILDQAYSIEQIIEIFEKPTMEIEEMLATLLSTHCTPEELEKYVESDLLYECTPYGRYLQSCIQYMRDNVEMIAAKK